MARDDDTPKPPEPHNEDRLQWWAEDAPSEASLPEGFPERPDLKRVKDLRSKIQADRESRRESSRGPLARRFDKTAGQQARAIGSYTLIPMLMLAGPAVGYGLGWLAEQQWGGKPWVSVFGVLFGLAAAFQQIFLILKKNAEKNKP